MNKYLYKFIIFISIVIISLIITGCGNSNSIKGTWNYYNDGSTSNDTYYIFNNDSTGSYTYAGNTKNFTYEDRGTKVIITFEGNTASNEFDYSINDGILTIQDSTGSNLNYKRN